MNNSNWVMQDPAPGTRILMFRGDTRTFTLSLSHPEKGGAWLRTNIGHAQIARNEIIREVNHDEPPLGRDWFDIPMKRVDDRHFQVTLPLCEVGHFQAKSFFLKEGESSSLWPRGPNTIINVETADTCCSNIIYNAFVRQFGPNKGGGGTPDPSEDGSIQVLDKAGYAVIPPSGTFRDLIRELDFIVGELGCRILQLLPIHPTPTTYPCMGRFGSPYAALSFTAVDPALAEFDTRVTPLEQFIELVDAVHERNAKVLMDIAINHTGWAASLHTTHPQWLIRDSDGRIKVPGAWGVLWEDLTALDYTHKDLWRYMADIFLTWCRRGVDGFRCDAGYMIPVPAWKYIVAIVRDQYPDTVFLLEGLGGKSSVTRDILNTANFDWAYSELFQNYDRNQIENYLPEATEISKGDGIMIHFAETHDNIRLASRSKVYARMRTALCALCSQQGGFGFANGVEWYATEKIDVHESPSLNWGATSNQVQHIRRLNTLLKAHPAFYDKTDLKLIQQEGGNHIVLMRHHLPSGKRLLIVANLDDKNETLGSWNPQQAGMDSTVFVDLLSEEDVTVAESGGQHTYLLEPGQVLCLTADKGDIGLIRNADRPDFTIPERIERQRLRTKALDVFRFYGGVRDLEDFDTDQAAKHLAEDPVEYCRSLNPFSQEPRVITWQWPNDVRREVMVPPEHFLLVRSGTSFRAQIVDKGRVNAPEESLSCSDGSFFALFSPLPAPKSHRPYTLKLSVYTPGHCEHIEAPLLSLSRAEDAGVKRIFRRSELLNRPLLLLGSNGRGSMLRANVSWGELRSKYDALLAANLNPVYPEDRRIMFTRCRAWIVFQDYSQEICNDCLDSFCFDYNSRGFWRYRVPTGQGEYILFNIGIEMVPGKNTVRMVFSRHTAGGEEGKLADHEEVRLILRPDIEDRNFHEITKAYTGPEYDWPNSVEKHSQGFIFAPEAERKLHVWISKGGFVWEPEWHYMVHRPLEAERGLDPDSDLFSPGYFSAILKGGEAVELTAQIGNTEDTKSPVTRHSGSSAFEENTSWKLDEALKGAVDHYVVKRENFKTVIAGYPWFLDWGRDTLIFIRGLIKTERTEDVRAILKQFGQFEREGTIPNVIHGKDIANRDTSDAPLWFFLACSDLVCAEGNEAFLDAECGDRTIRQVLLSIGRFFTRGTFNGIRMDTESGLIFSPAHFTWMDTNHPAGTPREGYPIEIQALWYAALSFLARIDPDGNGSDWEKRALQVQSSILDFFMLEEEGYLSDCLHARPGVPASRAEQDDALRPNQLFAVTLEAVTDTTVARKIVTACEELLVPGAIRSLADRAVRHPLPIVHQERVSNDPLNPYQGKYAGDEDSRRKPAYHNGTAWTWLFPTFCEAWIKAYGNKGKETALAWLASSTVLINRGCAGHVPEILDGDFPHRQRGCDAQAWGASELLRVFLELMD
ncbi:MAG: glycogen debranching protein [Planctomycetaceae bacterium]|nr:MAG: glycogen debranching protein [Planctomycetaceae bacterium]